MKNKRIEQIFEKIFSFILKNLKGGIFMDTNDKIIETKLFSSYNELDIRQICAILEDNNIPFIRKENGVGSYLSMVWGRTNINKTIFVSDEDFKKASKLISAYTAIKEEDDDDEEENDDDIKKYKRIRRSLVLVLVIVPVCLLIFVVGMTILASLF